MNRLASLMFAGAATVAFFGCATEETSPPEALVGNASLDMDDCVKIEGADIGRAGVSVTLGDLSVEFTSWLAKDGEPTEFVGFTLSGSASFFVKAGSNAEQLFAGSGTSWANPNGTAGSAVKGISNIQICEIKPPPPEGCGSETNPCPPPTPPEGCGSETFPCPPQTPECGGETNPCPPPPPEECGSETNPCPPPPPEECGSETNPCPPPPPEECGSETNPCPPPPCPEEDAEES